MLFSSHTAANNKRSVLYGIVLFLLSLILFTCTACSGTYGKEIVGKWSSEDGSYVVFLDSGDFIYSEKNKDYPSGTYTVDKDGLVSVLLFDAEESIDLQMTEEEDEWSIDISSLETDQILKKETSDVSKWDDIVKNLDSGDRIEGTTWHVDSEGESYTYEYTKDGDYQLKMNESIKSAGMYTAYYGTEALEFLGEYASSVQLDVFKNTDGTFFASEIDSDDGKTWIYYGFLKGDTMEVLIDGSNEDPVVYTKK